MTTGKIFFIFLSLIVAAASSYAADNNYVDFKPGINLSQIGGSTDFKSGFNFEIAFGNLFSPDVATELEIGILRKKYTPPDQRKKAEFNIFPLAWSFKKLFAFKKGEYYGLGGIGVYYFREREIEPGVITQTARETDFGFHAGLGLHYDITRSSYIGIEGRYTFFLERAFRKYRMDGMTGTAFLGLRF
jgi:opacity protein-like surface antigen